MKTFSLFLLVCLSFISFSVQADQEWRKNKLQAQAEQDRIQEAVDNIPIYRARVGSEYDILGPVHGEDFLTRNKNAIFYQMRVQAYEMGAEAISEFKCKPLLKNTLQSCDGFGVKQRDSSGDSPAH